MTLTAGEEKQIARRETVSTEAYEAFLKGFAHYRLKTPDDFEQALPYFEEAATTVEEAVRRSTYIETPIWLVATSGHLERLQDAGDAIQTFNERREKQVGFLVL